MEPVRFDKITERLQGLIVKGGLQLQIDATEITQKIAGRIHDKIKTSEIDELSSTICTSEMTDRPVFGELAGLIVADNHQKSTETSFLKVVKKLSENTDRNGDLAPLVSEELLNIARSHNDFIDNMIDFERDFDLGYFSFQTLKKGYLLKSNGKIEERPQHLFARVSIGIHGEDMPNVRKTYDMLSKKYYTHATPTLFHSGTPRPQMSSCFLLGTHDSVEGIYKTITDCARISKWAGGIGVHISNIRANGSYIRKTGGVTDGIVPMLKVYNDTSRYINQSGKRKGSFAFYLEPWHADVFKFLEAKKNHGQEEERAKDLFYAMWVPDLFMKAVQKDLPWYLMCPDECPGLCDTYGDEFQELYEQYVSEKRYRKEVKARKIWDAIISSQIETGTPYMCYKDAVNRKSNQKNIGVIKSSNLCAEINLVSDADEYAVCNLASLCLPKILDERTLEDLATRGLTPDADVVVYGFFEGSTKKECSYCELIKADLTERSIPFREATVEEVYDLKHPEDGDHILEPDGKEVRFPQVTVNGERIGGSDALWQILKPTINWDRLGLMTESLTENLNKIIDKNFYPTEETRNSNMRHRPLGIGVQGLADLFMRLRLPFASAQAKALNRQLFEHIYFNSLNASNKLAAEEGAYSTFKGSPLSKGMFQFDLWDAEDGEKTELTLDGWDALRARIVKSGVRNSVLLAVMPTASTSQIMGNNECCEAYTNNLYTRRTLAGEFVVTNKHLNKDLQKLGLWREDARDLMKYDRGSVQRIPGLPPLLREVYKTVWEIPQKDCIQMSADRGRFVDQSQSLNLHFSDIGYKKLSAAHLFGWSMGLKTGSYYVRGRPALNSQRFTMDPDLEKRLSCEMCSG